MNYKLAHIGINCESEGEAANAAALLGKLFGWEVKEKAFSVYSDSAVECMKAPGLGKNGHIGIAVACVSDAVDELKNQGVAFRPGSEKYNPDGTLRLIYLEDEICGFALHLVEDQKK